MSHGYAVNHGFFLLVIFSPFFIDKGILHRVFEIVPLRKKKSIFTIDKINIYYI